MPNDENIPYCDKACRFQEYGHCMRKAMAEHDHNSHEDSPCGFGTCTDPYGDLPDEVEPLDDTYHDHSISAYW